ncbi:unnamed protein product, partial [Phaeothamnion confervicola]
GVAEQADLGAISNLLVRSFNMEVKITEGEFSEQELDLVRAPLNAVNRWINSVSYFECYYGMAARLGPRVAAPGLYLCRDSLVLAVRDPDTAAGCGGGSGRHGSGSDYEGDDGGHGRASDGRGEIVACVELDIRRPDGKLPFNIPESDAAARPYLCNLAVAERARGRGVGKQLVRLCEHVARNIWGHRQVYLHVDLSNAVATELYRTMGYKPLPEYDEAPLARRLLAMPHVRYHVKQLVR